MSSNNGSSDSSSDSLLRRLRILTIVVGIAGAVVVLLWQGARPAAGFLIGGVLSMLNLEGISRLTYAIGGASKPGAAAAALIALRYVLIGVALYVIVKFLGFAPVVVLAGFLSAFGAVLLEALYQLAGGGANL